MYELGYAIRDDVWERTEWVSLVEYPLMLEWNGRRNFLNGVYLYSSIQMRKCYLKRKILIPYSFKVNLKLVAQ